MVPDTGLCELVGGSVGVAFSRSIRTTTDEVPSETARNRSLFERRN